MKSLNLYGKEDIRYELSTMPQIERENDVIVKVKAVGICGSDISRYKKLGPYVKGMTFGHEFAGEIVDVGPGVKTLKAGDRIAGCPASYCGQCASCRKGELARCEELQVLGAKEPGAYAEYVKISEEQAVPLPANVDYDTAAMTEPSSVVAHGFYRTTMKPGAAVAVMGCGSIGLLAIQWARIFGAQTIYAIDIDDNKLKVAKEVGADVTINSLESPAHEQLDDYSNGTGVDLAVEAAGSPVTSAQVFALPKKGGEVVFMGIPYADIEITRFYFEKIVRNELTVLGSWNAISAPFPGSEWSASLHYMSTGQLQVKPLISHRLTLEVGPQTFAHLIQGEGSYVKVIFYPEL
ncbi:galactitol-1-phosphate 5-dehydrogenase [Salsuginibacillus kocurii]|uniref:galactitol-1-phosphate 5-dehydrogenase n=1 Tax=Salsuginibacillus kocurii TaxID=427078 RepID=UPI00035F71A6|nr:galactitol-1-phosphate 5-dehydrogenase [Salsuginibacillus kocurii]